jgi:hypothetical protein
MKRFISRVICHIFDEAKCDEKGILKDVRKAIEGTDELYVLVPTHDVRGNAHGYNPSKSFMEQHYVNR